MVSEPQAAHTHPSSLSIIVVVVVVVVVVCDNLFIRPACPPVEVWSVATEKQVEHTHTCTHTHTHSCIHATGRQAICRVRYGRPLELLPFATIEEGWRDGWK